MTAKEKAERAKAILEDEVFAEALQITEQDLIGDWRQAQSTEARERFWYALKETNRLTVSLRKIAEQAHRETE